MTNCKKISYLIVALCMLETVFSATTVDNSKSASYARTDDKGQEVSSSILGSIYHKSRQSRCVTCYEDRRYGEDRSRYYGGYAARSGDDRASSWYYSGYDRYDDRGYRGADYDRYDSADRYGADRYGPDRYGAADRYGDRYGAAGDRYAGYRDDRYGGSRPTYDRYDSRTRNPYERPGGYDRGESRGYGYDNRDRGYYGGSSDYYGRDRYYDRPRYGSAGAASSGYGAGYDRDYYERYPSRYDYRPYRPWDDAYRGQSGYDSSGRGYYYAKGTTQEDRRYLPEPGYNSPAISPCGVRKPNCPYDPQDQGTRVTSGTIDSGYYNMGVSQTNYNTNSYSNRNDSTKGSGPSSGWSYMREDDQSSRGGSNGNSGSNTSSNNNNNNRDRTRDQQSSAYGALLDRESNLIAVAPVKSNDNANDSMATSSDQQKDKNVDDATKQNDNGQNS